ncbi:hypothetical protein [Vibrio astriarenae]|nr:hypothetical protein [Vibrio astriarenae]
MMKKFNHVGIPTQQTHENETLNAEIGVFTTDFEQSENKIEWLRFLEDSPMPEELKNTAHVAYEVDDLDAELQGKKVLIEPFYANEKLRIAFVMEDEAPIELMQYV